MSCYTRHLGELLPPEPTWADRRAFDVAVRAEFGLTDADCPEVWAAVKKAREADDGFVDRVRVHVASASAGAGDH